MKDTRESLKRKYRAGEISVIEFRDGLQEIEAKDREQREKLIERLEQESEIVRGKERKYCGNCKHQPEPLTTCDWLKSQTVVFKECPRWERKE